MAHRPRADEPSPLGAEMRGRLEQLHGPLGPTGEFPDGKLGEDDKGGLAMAVGIADGMVVIDFGGAPVAWLALDADDAMALAQSLARKAIALGRAEGGGDAVSKGG